MTVCETPARDVSLVHLGLFYDTAEHYTATVGDWVAEGLAAGEPTLVAAPPDNLALLRTRFGDPAAGLRFLDMTVVGANPARIIPAIASFLADWPGQRTRFVGEPIWPGRTPVQVQEATRHEALINFAFAAHPTSILCPYDSRVDSAVLADALCTHPLLLDSTAGAQSCPRYDTSRMLIGQHPRPKVPANAERLMVVTRLQDLVELRRMLTERATRAGVSARRCADLLIAVGELTTNALVHSEHPAQVACWVDEAESALVVEVAGKGRLTDPMAGRELRPTATGGRGLWIVNQLCDLTETHSGPWGTVTRVHAHL